VVASFYDALFRGKPSRDWVGAWNAFMDKEYGHDVIDAAIAPYRNPPQAPTAAAPESAYLGTYQNDYVGRAVVSQISGKLSVALGPTGATVFPLKHYDGNLFLIYPSAETPTVPSAVRFAVGPDGRMRDLVLDEFNGDGQGRMVKSSH